MPSHLQDLVERYIRATFSDMSREWKERRPDSGPIAFHSAQTGEIILEIAQELKGFTIFRDIHDLAQFLSDSLATALLGTEPKELDISRLAAQITNRLADPLQPFSFTAPLTFSGQLSFSLHIGGEYALEISSEGEDHQFGMLVSGQILAVTESSAIVAVEEIIGALLGVCHVLDLCMVLTPLPGSRHSASITITPHDETIPSELSADISAGIASTVFHLPPNLTDLERR